MTNRDALRTALNEAHEEAAQEQAEADAIEAGEVAREAWEDEDRRAALRRWASEDLMSAILDDEERFEEACDDYWLNPPTQEPNHDFDEFYYPMSYTYPPSPNDE